MFYLIIVLVEGLGGCCVYGNNGCKTVLDA